jgi:aspartyl protease/PDZ domain-containing protein
MNAFCLRVASLALFALSFALPAAARASASDDRISHLIALSRAALGGAALDRVRFLKLEGKAVSGGLTGTAVAWQEVRGLRFAESYSAPPIAGSDGYDGTHVWNGDGSGLVWVDGGTSGRSQEISLAFASNYALWGAQRGGAQVTWGGTKSDSAHRAYDALVVTAPHSAVPFELWFDRSTHLPARYVQTVGPVSSTTTLSDWRPVNGVKVPYRLVSASSDGNSSSETVTRAIADPAGAAAQLRMPRSNVHDFSIAGNASQTIVPIDLAENHVYLSVMLNGKGPYRFIYDTGGANIVDPAVAKEIGAVGSGSIQGGGVGATTESVSFANVDSLKIGDAVLRKQLFGVAPTRMGFGLSAGQPVDGLIGFEVLSRFITTFDYANRRVILRMPQAGVSTAGASIVPFVLYGRQPQFACAINGIAAQCAVDTGARNSVSLFAPFSASHPQVVPKTLSGIGVNGFGFGGAALGRLGRLPSLRIGSYTLPNVVADYTAQTKGAFAAPFMAANIGGGIWKRFTLTLDYGKHIMVLVPNASFGEPDAYERAGLFLLNRGGKYVVLDARAGTPSAEAGIAKGDTIDSIDGKPTAAMSLQAVREMFLEPAGTVLHLGLTSKDGKARSVSLTLRDYV